MLRDPGSGSKVWKLLNREIGESGKDRGQIVAPRKSQSTTAFHDRKDRRDFGSRLRVPHMYPISSSDCDRPHGVLRQAITQLQFGIFQEPVELLPQRERVVAGLGRCTSRQCSGACRFDLFPNPIQ